MSGISQNPDGTVIADFTEAEWSGPDPHEVARTILELCHENEAGRITAAQLNAIINNLMFPARYLTGPAETT